MIEQRLLANAEMVEKALAAYYTTGDVDFASVVEAQKYSLFARAKRIRPTLVLEFCRLFGGKDEAALPFAAAIEMLHTYSLIHDDLPCMDDDDLRRGRPTCHKAYGEATAVLAGDALLTRAFGVIASNPYVSADVVRNAVCVLAEAAGDHGMIGGQVMDLFGEGKEIPLSSLQKLHENKTGALIRASAILGCLAASLSLDDERTAAACRYAESIGLAFQIVDDILDATSNTETLGKTVGSDKREKKTTFLTYYTPEKARELAASITDKAKQALAPYEGSWHLIAVADYLERRMY